VSASAVSPVALVTGANKGIGFATAAGLGGLGFRVLVGARDPERGGHAAGRLRADGFDAEFVALDVTSDTSVLDAARRVEATAGQLDVLVNNAAIKLETSPSPPSECTLELVRTTFETNVFGTIRTVLAMLPLMRSSLQPRIVNVSSALGSSTLATTLGSRYMEIPLLSYSTSKAALNSVTVQFANELRGTPFKVNAADPGYTKTDMTVSSRPTDRTSEEAADVVIRLATLGPDGPTGAFFDQHGEVPW
jgi:NAD(P)-dependent dehydrogenase (short-subunit alcohol dehydrogenase family)